VPDRARLTEDLERLLGVRVVLHGTIASTMAAALADRGPAPVVHLAHAQNAGRGRHGRTWESPPGNLYATIRWPEGERAFPPGLLAAVQLTWARAIRSAGGPDVRCKWPNDGMLGNAKWAGLIAVRPAERPGELHLGLGANLVAAPPSVTDPPATELRGSWLEWPGEEAVVALLVSAALAVLREEPESIPAHLADWVRFDALTPGEAVVVEAGGRSHIGRYRGVDADGRLVVDKEDGATRFASGEVTRVRRAGAHGLPSAGPPETG
jgi:BirA family biotin operon repressor/biotin-[acetyl-CoA-carboxylase] ligase